MPAWLIVGTRQRRRRFCASGWEETKERAAVWWRMKSDLNIGNIFNFFVTAYHVHDYIKNTANAPTADLKNLLQQQDFETCRFLCHKGKHLQLNDPTIKHQDATVHRRPGSGFNQAAFNTTAFNAGPKTTFTVDGRVVDIHALAGRIIHAWEAFFVTHHIA